MTDAVSAVLCDAGPLVHLDELSAPDLLDDFKQVYVPEAVWSELLRCRPLALHALGKRLQRVALGEAPDDLHQAWVRALSLGAGLPHAIQLARQHAPAVLLCDDAAGRLVAELCSLKARGTLGLVVRAARRGRRSAEDVLDLLERLPDVCSLRLRRDLLASLIERFKIDQDLD